MNKENCALKLVDEIILYYDARLKKHEIVKVCSRTVSDRYERLCTERDLNGETVGSR